MIEIVEPFPIPQEAQLGLFGEKDCPFCGKFTDHGAGEISRLEALGWTQILPVTRKDLVAIRRVPFCGNSTTTLWKP